MLSFHNICMLYIHRIVNESTKSLNKTLALNEQQKKIQPATTTSTNIRKNAKAGNKGREKKWVPSIPFTHGKRVKLFTFIL